jgi:hypothetical protein
MFADVSKSSRRGPDSYGTPKLMHAVNKTMQKKKKSKLKKTTKMKPILRTWISVSSDQNNPPITSVDRLDISPRNAQNQPSATTAVNQDI